MHQPKAGILFFPKIFLGHLVSDPCPSQPGTLGVRPLSQPAWDTWCQTPVPGWLGQGSDTGVPLFNLEGARSIENRKHHDTDIGEDGNPHVGNSDCAE